MLKPILLLSALSLAVAASAQLAATGSIAYTQSAGVYTYDITVHNTGTTTLGTLWYAWIPGEDYLPGAPANYTIIAPSGWNTLKSNAAGFGTGLRWAASNSSLYIPAGGSMSGFKFSTTTTPAELLGLSIYESKAHPGQHLPVGTTFVYSGAPFSDNGFEFVVNPVPEPVSLIGLAGGALALVRRRRKG